MANDILIKRIKRAKNLLKQISPSSCLLLCSGTEIIKSRDISFDFKQDKNFFYFTNSNIKNACLLIYADNNKDTLLLAPYQTKEEILWLGADENAKALAKNIGAEFIDIEYSQEYILPFLKNCNTLLYNSYKYSISNSVAKMLLEENSAILEKRRLPFKFINQDFLMSELRQVKDKQELDCIKKAIKITYNALNELQYNFLRPGITELDAKNFLDYEFRKQGGDIAFDTICAGGKNAATLHHTSTNKVLKKGEMLLIDCGAEYNMYSADISRTIPVGGTYTEIQQELIDAVLRAQKAAIKSAKAGKFYGDIQKAAENSLINSLIEIGVFKNKKKVEKENLIREYFPHSVGHLLGLDTHDIGRLFLKDKIEKGMVITIEPGLYFSKKVNDILPCGIRIEDDILVGDKGGKILK